jgi:inosose dehydratase/3D-(3,5/4)-trihydroxycyclohexane-1,2-dione acylhydrolase (decyclizing)
MTIRIGANPIIWSNDDLKDLGGATPLETCLAEAQAIGFEGMELGHKFPREAGALRAILERFNLRCVSGWYSAELLRREAKAEVASLRPHLDLLKAMGSPVLVFAEVSGAVHGQVHQPLSQRPVLQPSQWREFGRRMTEVGKQTASEGVQLVYHHHMGTVVQSEEDVDKLMEVTGPEVHLLLDTGHATFAGADPVALAKRYRERIRHIHTKDVRNAVLGRALQQDWSFLRAVVEGIFTVPGDGDVAFARVFRELSGYSGWVVLEAEQDPEKANPQEYASKGYAELRRLIMQDLT